MQGVAVCRYFFGAIRWVRTDVVRLDRDTRKVLKWNKCHHLNAAVERLYLPHEEGLQNLEHEWEREVVSAVEYLERSEDEQVQGALKPGKGGGDGTSKSDSPSKGHSRETPHLDEPAWWGWRGGDGKTRNQDPEEPTG